MKAHWHTAWLALVPLAFAPFAFAQAPTAPGPPPTAAVAAEAPLTNADVVKLCKLDLGDEVVIAKINQAKTVDFKLDTDSLVKLKQEGVSKPVIEAMLKRTSPPPQEPAQAVREAMAAARHVAAGEKAVRLRTKSGDVELKGRRGEFSSTWAYVTTLMFLDWPGAASDVRITEPRPAILARLGDNPKASHAFIVKTDPSKRKDKRSLKIGKTRMVSVSFGYAPDEDWTIPYDATEEEPGLWRLTPRADLKAGEYGFYVQGELYDFGVDK